MATETGRGSWRTEPLHPVLLSRKSRPCLSNGSLMKARDVSPLRVLVVDDYPDTRRSLRPSLGSWGHEAREATDGADALRVAESFRPGRGAARPRPAGLDGCEVALSVPPTRPPPPLLVAVLPATPARPTSAPPSKPASMISLPSRATPVKSTFCCGPAPVDAPAALVRHG